MRDRAPNRRLMAAVFLLALLVWAGLVLMAPFLALRTSHAPSLGLATSVYVLGGVVCHQRSERSFHVGGVQQPVCARCLGLYAAAPFGASLALAGVPLWRSRRPVDARARRALLVAALPMALSVLAEWSGAAQPGPEVRLVTAVPIGLATAWIVTHAIEGHLR